MQKMAGTVSFLLCLLPLLVSEALCQDVCMINKFPRTDCGFIGIKQDQCMNQNCCWDPQDDQPWCFKKTVPTPSTPTCLPDQPRYECGYVGIDQGQCEAQGCCWDPADDVPWCYQKTGGVLPSQCKVNGPRFDCGTVGTTEQTCAAAGCCWSPAENQPWCFFQTPIYTVQSINQTASGVKMTLVTNNPTALPYGPNISPLTFELWEETLERLHFKFTDPKNQRWEVPQSVLPTPPPSTSRPQFTLYTYTLPKVGEEFSIAVKRGNLETIFNTTSVGTLQFGNQYLSLGTQLPVGHHIYGLGERKSHLRVTPDGANCGSTYPLWNADVPSIPENFNLYGSHPFYLEMRKNGLAHGVFLKNSNGMDVVVEETALQFKTIGGVLDFYVFLGPSPEGVIQQHQEVIGRPLLPPYWALGFHQCRYGYEHLQDLKDVINGYANSKIPLDVVWSDIDYMDGYRDFTLDPTRFPASDVQQFIKTIHGNGQKYVMIIDPGIKIDKGYPAYDRGMAADIFFKDYNGNNYQGIVWPGDVYFPDFFNPKIESYWQQEFSDFFDNLADADGIWLDMNECANFCDGVCSASPPKSQRVLRDGYGFNPNDPPYYINNRCYHSTLYTRTVPVDAEHYGGVLEYDAHNLYGMMESMTTRRALLAIRPNERPFILTRANFPGTGSHAVHWNGDNSADETDLYFSIPMMLSYQLYGIPFVGSDICGFFHDTTEELCSRWMELGAFYPFARNHNFKGNSGQEPYRWDSVASISRKYLGIRYSLLPYYYTLLYKAHRPVDKTQPPSATVMRPLFFEFPHDENTRRIDWQFLLGSSLLFTPVLRVGDPGRTVTAYFPSGSRWYDWYSYGMVSNGGENQVINTPVDFMPIHIRDGSVIPMQEPGLTTQASLLNPFYLLVTLNTTGGAIGDVYIDDGESDPVTSYTFVEYIVTRNTLKATPTGTGYASNRPPLDRVIVIGVASSPSVVTKDGVNVPFSYDSSKMTLTIGKGLKIGMDTKYSINWK